VRGLREYDFCPLGGIASRVPQRTRRKRHPDVGPAGDRGQVGEPTRITEAACTDRTLSRILRRALDSAARSQTIGPSCRRTERTEPHFKTWFTARLLSIASRRAPITVSGVVPPRRVVASTIIPPGSILAAFIKLGDSIVTARRNVGGCSRSVQATQAPRWEVARQPQRVADRRPRKSRRYRPEVSRRLTPAVDSTRPFCSNG
jgi:hypothetical protein